MAEREFVINMDKPCAECGKHGATPSGLGLECLLKAMNGTPMKSREGRIVQERFKKMIKP